MKHITISFCLMLLALGLQNCSEKEETTPTNEKVQFSLDLKNIPESSTLRVSIQKSSGESILTLQEVELRKDGDIVTTEPLELARGNYKITDFLIVNKEKEVSFATPKKGSPMANLVKNPVDLDFSVNKGVESRITMEVVNVANSLPENFGYETFNLDIVRPLKLAVYVPSGTSTKFAYAKAYVVQNTDTLQSFNLSAKVNVVPFKQEADQHYTLVVVKDGYVTTTTDFVYSGLAGAVLTSTLTESFAFTTYYESGFPFTMNLAGIAAKTLHIDWGDGTTDTYTLPDGDLTHEYPSTGIYAVNITGDIKYITSVYSYYGDNKLQKINFSHLSRLEDVIMGWTQTNLEVLDFTGNTKLEFLNLEYIGNLKTITLPASNNIGGLWISGPNKLTVTSLNDAIKKLHTSAVEDNRHGGSFNFSKESFGETSTMLHTPSQEALTMLRDLRDNYQWNIYPNP